ncbi:NAD-dependent epimerase/dehydratase family protein [Archangium violaceum]|uniref:NAD-dependent epimerase/dehydratase family protein n=1 Tax=Archangium violaceum TaxID=83451 RepID=UPI002B2A17B6|nr:NAD-dependent epimerase/dehydratase family protein [Archangium gephyra]
MSTRRILITGGAGFVGSTLALSFKRDEPGAEVIAFDNLRRRGSEVTLSRLRAGGVSFVHGDVRNREDLEAVGAVDLLVECSAEPSVHAGYDGSPDYLVHTNLLGLIHCLEHLRRTGGDLVFLSTSRVYPIASLRALPLVPEGDRLVITEGASGPGWSRAGIDEHFPLEGGRSLYGATKLSGELMIREYVEMYGMKAVINRCGVLAGPWQMGKVDQGFAVLWVARHVYGGELAYMGFGGEGRQVRDLLHVDDLYELVRLQAADLGRHNGAVYNVGGGPEVSVSLRELTRWCEQVSGRSVPITRRPETRPADIPYYVSDCSRVREVTGWKPTRPAGRIVEDIHRWLIEHRAALEPILGA